MIHFSRTLGLDEAKTSLAHALTTNTFPHALLVHGPEGVGQNALVLDLVDLLICEAEETRPCGQCAGCLGRKRKNLDNIIFIMPLEKKEKASSEGEIEGNQVEELTQKAKEFHADPYGFVRTEKSRINIAQIRDLKSRLAYAEVSGRPRIVVLLWAETMPQEAANALLKTLEEPPANTFFLLSCEDRSSLLPTIVSRCTQIALLPFEPGPFAALCATHGKALGLDAAATRLLPFADGSVGILLNLQRNGGDTLLEEARLFLEAALGGDWRNFADYLESSDAFADLEASASLLHFLLRMLRLYHRLKTEENQGIDPELARYFIPLATGPSLDALAQLVEEILAAVQSYAKPKVAALGLFLDFEAKYARKETPA